MDIERGKVPSSTTAVSPFLYCFTMSWWVGGSFRMCSFLFFGIGAAAAAAHKVSTDAERGTGYCFFLLRLCPLHCDASDFYCCCCSRMLLFVSFILRCFVLLLTALLLRRDACWKIHTYRVIAKGRNGVRAHFYLLVEVLLLLLLLRAAAAAHNISTEAEVLLFLFWWLRCCCSSLIERDVLKK